MRKQKVWAIIEKLKKENCRCQDNLVCTTCAILDELKERIENEEN